MKRSKALLTTLFFILMVVTVFKTSAQSGFKSEDDLIRQAEKYFSDKNFEKALPLFSQVVSNRPENAHFNYCLGVCIMNAGSDKASASRFLDIATKSPQSPSDAWIYLGKSLHLSGRYDEALSAYDAFRKYADKNEIKKWDTETLIAMSRNALNTQNDLSLATHKIISKNETVFADVPSLYTFEKPEGRFLAMPQQYEMKQTKGKPESMFVFLSNNTPVLVYSNQSTKGNHGFDIFKAVREPNGNWLPAEALQDVINTSADEAFPVITNGGKTIYFSSKGTFSTGGYDIFRSDFDNSTGRWSDPVNMGSPVNSPEDDFYYVPAADQSYAYVSSTRESAPGKCSVYKVSIDEPKGNFVAVEGVFTCPQQLDQSEAKITIVDPSDKTILLQFRTQPSSGAYFMKLPVGSKYSYQVEMKGFDFQEQLVDLSSFKSSKIIQEITLTRESDRTEKMVITNREPVLESIANTAPGIDNHLAIANTVSDPEIALSNSPEVQSPSNVSQNATGTTDPASNEIAGNINHNKNSSVSSDVNETEPVKDVVANENNSSPNTSTVSKDVNEGSHATANQTKDGQTGATSKSIAPIQSSNETTPAFLVSVVAANKEAPVNKKEDQKEITPSYNSETPTPDNQLVSVVKNDETTQISSTGTIANKTAAAHPDEAKQSTSHEIEKVNDNAIADNINHSQDHDKAPKSSSEPMVIAGNTANNSVPATTEKQSETTSNGADTMVGEKQNSASEAKLLTFEMPVEQATSTTANNTADESGEPVKKENNIVGEDTKAATVTEPSAETKSELALIKSKFLHTFFNMKKKQEPEAEVASPETVPSIPEAEQKVIVNEAYKNVIFKVQLGAFSNKTEEQLANVFREKGIYNLTFQHNAAGMLQVLTGNETAYENAQQLKDVLVDMGFKDAFIVVFAENHQIPVELVVQVTE